MRARLSYSMPPARTTLWPCVTTTGRCELDALDVAERLQELAAKLDLLLAVVRRPGDLRVADQLHLAAVAIGERLRAEARVTTPSLPIARMRGSSISIVSSSG